MVRDFLNDIKEDKFKKVTYTIYNKMDDEQFIIFLENTFNESFSIEDFKYYDFDLTEKEKFLIRMHNKEYLQNIKNLKESLNEKIGAKIYVDYDSGKLRIVKLNNVIF